MNSFRSLCDLPNWPKDEVLFQGSAVATTVADVLGLTRALVVELAERKRRGDVRRIAIACEDPSAFLASLLACFACRVTTILPGVTSPGGLTNRADQFDHLITDTEIARLFSAAQISDGAVDLPEAAECNLVFFTSGSTAAPQPIPKSWRQIEAEAETLQQQFGSDVAGARVVATVPHHHIYGILFNLVWPLATGRALFVPRQISVDAALDHAEQCPTVIVSCPAHMMRLGSRPVSERAPVMVFSSGAPLMADSARAMAQISGSFPVEVYGSTETGGIGFRTQAVSDQKWTVFPGVDVRYASSGCLAVRSAVTPGADWFETSDLCTLSPDGLRFQLGGRNDRVLKIEGVRVSLPRIEALAQANSCVLEAAALGVDTDKGQKLAMVATLTPEGEQLLQSKGKFRLERVLSTAIRTAENAASAPKLWRFVREIPTNERGKRQAAALAALFSG
ncbi:AMP-binding protein [Ruegeria sp. MALMAid1280]|uniref:AMP-binding protein n=1 Tax=Ruegeria sp. MALMAid1280 TaxID=3411634 RepID=UPI003BA013F0